MSMKTSLTLLGSVLLVAACAQTGGDDYVAPERGDPEFLKGKDTRADELYLNANTQQGGRDFRDVYIAPADLGVTQIIQPEGAEPDEEWQFREGEIAEIQEAIEEEFTAALAYHSAFNIVESREAAEIVVHTTVVAIHPNQTRAEVEAGARGGGAITVSIALVNAATGDVMVRSVDTKSTDNIWAFHQVENDDPAVNLIFRAWGNSMRRGMLALQGRSNDPLAPVINTKQQ